MQHARPAPRQNAARSPRQAGKMPQRCPLRATTILAILREQAVPDAEARRRVNSDPLLRAELAATVPESRSHR